VESAVFAANGNASLEYILNEGLLAEPALVRAGWRVLGALSRLTVQADPTTHDERFEQSDEQEPHRERRRRLLAQFPAITALFGYDRRTIAVTIAVAITHLGVAALLAFTDASALVLLLTAYTVGAIGSHWLGQTIHETSHHLAARTPLANRVLAWFANAPMVLPIAETFHRYHLEHHVHLGTVSKDSDLPLPLELDLIGQRRLAKFVWLALYPFVYFARGARFARRLTFAEAANIVFMVLINVALYKTLGPIALAYLALSTFFGHGLHPVAAHFIHEHYLFAGRQETSSYYGPLNHVTFNVGFHVEHHDFMNIPGWRLPEYRALVDHEYRGLVSHDSWTCVLTNFILSRTLGPASRLVRVA
jgi:sphingolipid 4-desaturase/C4-monooxygenase